MSCSGQLKTDKTIYQVTISLLFSSMRGSAQRAVCDMVEGNNLGLCVTELRSRDTYCDVLIRIVTQIRWRNT